MAYFTRLKTVEHAPEGELRRCEHIRHRKPLRKKENMATISTTIHRLHMVTFFKGKDCRVHSVHLTRAGAEKEAKSINLDEGYTDVDCNDGYFVNGTVTFEN